MEILNKIIVCSVWTMQGPFFAIYLDNMLPIREQTGSRNFRILLWTVFELIVALLSTFHSSPYLQAAQLSFSAVGCLFLLWRFYQGRFFLRLTALFLLLAVQVALDLLFGAINIFLVGINPIDSRAAMGTHFVVNVTAMQIATIAVQGIVCHFWCQWTGRKRPLRYPAFLLGFAIVGACISLSRTFLDASGSATYGHFYAAVVCCLFFTVCAALLVLLNQVEKETIGRELEETRRRSELERNHYAAIEARREEMARIRHDYNNILTSVLHMLQTGSVKEAEQMLSELSVRVANTKETAFCPIPIINAVLTEKQQQCRISGIAFQTDLLLPGSLGIDDLDLCSALSNLMDNAIRACTPMAAAQIALSCRVIQGYLVIKCINPSPKAPGLKPEGTGYGIKILKEIAAHYQGDFFTEYNNGIFTAQLSLLVE